MNALAVEINAEHTAASRALQSGLEHARRAGELLVEAKALLAHGQWLPWLAKTCAVSERTAQAYMRIASRWKELAQSHPGNPQRVADLSLRDGLKLVARPESGSLGVHFSSESQEWYTPKEIVARAAQALGEIDLDPCSDPAGMVAASSRFTKEEDGLSKDWRGRVYMNPPYGRAIADWVGKLCSEYGRRSVTAAVALVPARVDTDWFRMFRDFPICFVRGRLKFSGHENSAPFPSAVVYVGNDIDRFSAAFSDLGDIWLKYDSDSMTRVCQEVRQSKIHEVCHHAT